MSATAIRRINIAQQFVRLGFGDHLDEDAAFYSADFLTQELSTTEVQAAMGVLPTINTFVPSAVSGGLDRFRGQVRGWKFGRCGTPVLHVFLPYWTHQVEERASFQGPVGTPVSEDARRDLLDRLRQYFVVEHEAHDFRAVEGSDHQFRAHWR